MPAKRKAAAAALTDAPPAKIKKTREGAVSTLVPMGARERAVKGEKNPDMLHMMCTDTKTGKEKELHFKKIVYARIDWDSAEDIAKINSWRNQLYGRAGLKAKMVIMWHPDEEAWLELYYHLLIIEGLKHGLMIPRAKDTLTDFNNFFMGKILIDTDGEELEPRKARAHNAFVSKMNRVIQPLKDRLEVILLGKSGDYFRPAITTELVKKYRMFLEELEKEGVEDVNGLFRCQDAKDYKDVSESPYTERAHEFFSTLAKEAVDVSMGDMDDEKTLVDVDAEPLKMETGKEILIKAVDSPSSAVQVAKSTSLENRLAGINGKPKPMKQRSDHLPMA